MDGTESPKPHLHATEGATLWAQQRAVLVIDIVESVPLLERHEADVVERWSRFVRELREQVLPRHGVRLIKSLGDGLRLLAPDAAAAAAAAVDIRARLQRCNAGCDDDAQIRLHTGIHVAAVAEDELDIYGRGVNIAARLAQLSSAGQILLSAEAAERLLPGLDPATEDLGDRYFKGVAEPVRVHAICDPAPAPGRDTAALATAAPAPPAPPARALRPTIGVLPFGHDAAAASAAAGLALGELLADELISALSVLPELQVVSRLSTSALAQRDAEPGVAAAALGADYLLGGRCHLVGDRVLVHAQLYDARRAETLLHLRETAPLASLAAPESPLVTALVAQTGDAILQRQIDLARRCALPNLAGYSLLLGGIALMHRLSRRDFARSRELLQQLAERWPRLATPHAWLARWHLFSVLQRWSDDPVHDRNRASESSQRALDLDAESSVALAVAGSVRTHMDHDVAGGLALYDRALAVNPSDSFAWMLRGTAHAFRGDGADAVRASVQARALSPLDPLHFLYDCHAAGAALAAEDAPRARVLAQRSLRANAQHLSTYRVLAIAQAMDGDVPAARDTVRRLLALAPEATVEAFLRTSPSAAYPIGQRFARLLREAGLPDGAGSD